MKLNRTQERCLEIWLNESNKIDMPLAGQYTDEESVVEPIEVKREGLTKVDVTFDHDTVWRSLDQMAELFPVI